MIISHKYKFIFIKTKKTAGTSLEVFLSQYCAANDVLTPIYPAEKFHEARNYLSYWNPLPEIIANRGSRLKNIFSEVYNKQRYFNHITAELAMQRTSKQIWDSYYKFCVDRNPWDKTLSHYHMVNKRMGGNVSFDEYLAKGDFAENLGYYTDSRGGLLVDKVIKYESLTDELTGIFNELGVPFSGSLGVQAKAGYRKDKRPYHEVYNDVQRGIVERIFSKEIKLHDYKF